MNKYKKLILSLTITLLSFAGVSAMARPIPKITTYNDLGKFVNQYSASDFLSNKKVFGTGQEGLLEVLVNAYNNLPIGARDIANNLFRSKFRMNSTQLNARLLELDKSKDIAAQLAAAQATIRTINQDKANLEGQLNQLSGKISNLQAKITSYKGKITDLQAISNDYEGVKFAMFGLQNKTQNLRGQRDNLQRRIAELRKEQASAQQLKPLEDQLAAANQEIAANQAKIAKHLAAIEQLEKRIADLEQLVPKADQFKLLLADYDAVIKKMEDYVRTDVNTTIVPKEADIEAKDQNAIASLIAYLKQAAKNLQNGIIGFDDELNALDTRWSGLGFSNTSQEANEIDAKQAAANVPYEQIETKQTDINEAIETAEKTADDNLKKDNEEQAAAILQKIEDTQKALDEAWAKTQNEELFPNIKLKEYLAQPTLLGTTTKEGLENALATLDKWIKESKALAKSMHSILLQASKDTDDLKPIDPVTVQLIDDAYVAGLDMVNRAENIGPKRWEQIKLLINARLTSPAITTIPAEEKLINDINDWISSMPNEGQIKIVHDSERNIAATIKTGSLDALEENLKQSALGVDETTKFIKKYNDFKNQAATYPAAKKALEKADARIAELEQIQTLAEANVAALEKEINAKKAGGGPHVEPTGDVVSDVRFTKDELNFKVGAKQYVVEDEPEKLDTFINEVTSLAPEKLAEVGNNIVAEISKITEANQRRQAYERIFGLLFAPYDEAKKATPEATAAMASIQTLMKPIFKEYPNKNESIFEQNLKDFDLKESDL